MRTPQPKVLAKLEEAFKDAPAQEPDVYEEIVIDDAPPQQNVQKRKVKSYDRKVNKKRGLLRYAACG